MSVVIYRYRYRYIEYDYRVAKIHRMPYVAGLFPQKSPMICHVLYIYVVIYKYRYRYGVATISRLLQIIGLCCRISPLL